MNGNRRTSASAVPNLSRGAQQPAVPTQSPHHAFPSNSSYTFQVTPPVYDHQGLQNPWEQTLHPLPPRPRVQSMHELYAARRVSAPYDIGGQQRMAFPEPVFYGSPSPPQNLSPPPRLTHHQSQSDLGASTSTLNGQRLQNNASVTSFASSYNAQSDDAYYGSGSGEGYDDAAGQLVKGLSSEEALRRFQAGELPETDQEWHRLVPPEARDALGKQEVQRQSVIFEVIKSEREYVADLEAVQDVFIERLRAAKPPIISEPLLSGFINEVFGNLREILSHHQRLLAALFARQREQHPLIQSVADIILDTTLKADFRTVYETYIKHYPLAESHHRQQLKFNRSYEAFIHSVSNDPRIRKRDLITFLSRPVTKLPRLNLLLEQILKLTDTEYDHPDLETLPIILGILKDFIKSTQPGIEAAESKVKFWELCESLVFQKGEIIDMDLYDDSRSLAHSGPVMRRARSETGFSEKWSELVAALLDNYCEYDFVFHVILELTVQCLATVILTREEKRPNGSIRRVLMSRPMPLSFLRLGSFNAPAESRREKSEDGCLLESWRSQSVPVYPFTIYHASRKSARGYTLYVASEAQRKKWYNAFVDTIGVHKARQDANMWFNPQNLTDGFFRMPPRDGIPVSGLTITGRIQCAVPFVTGSPSRRFLAVGCGPGIYVAPVNSEKYQWVLNYKNPTALAALTKIGDKVFNRLIVHADSSLVTYSLDILARFALGQSDKQTLGASLERIGGNDVNIVLCKHVHLSGRALLIYSSKRRLGTSLTLQVLEAIDSEPPLSPRRPGTNVMRTFRPYGEPGYLPKDAYNIVSLTKTIGVCTSTGIIILDPTNLAQSAVTIVPNFQDTSNNEPMSSLKARVEGLKPLGFVRASADEFLVIYDEIGFYIDKRGVPVRRCTYIKWEVKAVSYAHRNAHILLVSPEFIEIRNITTGRIVQVIEGQDIRLLYSGPYVSKEDPVLIAMRGGKDDKDGVSDKIMELIETEEISTMAPIATTTSVWDEWDEWDM
ncbi:hypothetical protein BDZ97DRAFT_1916355 [Flammula alnicola]|nr:hypothetical protein BDZ97DRAFT_1916355 [Flammula alnicola]